MGGVHYRIRAQNDKWLGKRSGRIKMKMENTNISSSSLQLQHRTARQKRFVSHCHYYPLLNASRQMHRTFPSNCECYSTGTKIPSGITGQVDCIILGRVASAIGLWELDSIRRDLERCWIRNWAQKKMIRWFFYIKYINYMCSTNLSVGGY